MSPTEATLAWVEKFVIRHGLCPFAARPFYADQVLAVATDFTALEDTFTWALTQVQSLVKTEPSKVETSLLVFPHALQDFGEFMSFVVTLEDVLHESRADELIQLAHFHPDYQFAGVPPDDPGNRTNRSPHPTIQLLRVDSVSAAVAAYPNVDEIPARNIEKMRSAPPLQQMG